MNYSNHNADPYSIVVQWEFTPPFICKQENIFKSCKGNYAPLCLISSPNKIMKWGRDSKGFVVKFSRPGLFPR